jgi:hypothetical protein
MTSRWAFRFSPFDDLMVTLQLILRACFDELGINIESASGRLRLDGLGLGRMFFVTYACI